MIKVKKSLKKIFFISLNRYNKTRIRLLYIIMIYDYTTYKADIMSLSPYYNF